jgi:hypothetical protein
VRQAQRFLVRPQGSEKEKAAAQHIQDSLNERKQFIYKAFDSDERAEIAEYIAELRPRGERPMSHLRRATYSGS